MARISSCSYRLVRESVYNASQGLSQSVPWTIPSHSKKFHFGHNECAQNNKRNPLEQWNVNINVLQATVEIWNRWNFLSFFFCPYLVIYLDEKILRWTQPIRQIGTWQGRIWWSQGGGGNDERRVRSSCWMNMSLLQCLSMPPIKLMSHNPSEWKIISLSSFHPLPYIVFNWSKIRGKRLF